MRRCMMRRENEIEVFCKTYRPFIQVKKCEYYYSTFNL